MVSQIVREFFGQFERSRNTFDAGLIASQYADSFMFAGPDGVHTTDKQAWRGLLSKGRDWLKSLGHTSTTLVALDETTLDEHYVLVRGRFIWRFEQPSMPAIDVDVDATFILYIKDGTPTIVFQQEHENFQQALHTRGVLPSQS